MRAWADDERKMDRVTLEALRACHGGPGHMTLTIFWLACTPVCARCKEARIGDASAKANKGGLSVARWPKARLSSRSA